MDSDKLENLARISELMDLKVALSTIPVEVELYVNKRLRELGQPQLLSEKRFGMTPKEEPVEYRRISFDTEEFDTGGNYASTTFTAPMEDIKKVRIKAIDKEKSKPRGER